MSQRLALTYVEIDIPYCSRTYGVAPCTAALGVTGTLKCFNSLATCQDRDNFDDETATIRFAVDASYLPAEIDCIPAIRDVQLTPAIVSLGVDLGQRATLKVTLLDHPHSDTGSGGDKYLSERAYVPYSQGTFFGKFRARHPYLRGRALRLIRGFVGQALADMETRHYVIESFDGPTPDATYTLVAKDPLKLADDDRSQAPALSPGFLASDIASGATSATLSPTGIGATDYPASGYVAIGGKEICAFTRSGDTLTLTRAQYNTTAQAHSAQDRVQLCLEYDAEDPGDIICDLLVTYASVPASYITLADWNAETSAYLSRLYTALIAEPTGVRTLVSELVEQAALSLWWDDVDQKIRLRVLREISTDAARFTAANIVEQSLRIKEQPGKRISQVWTYFARLNPLKKLDDLENYRSTAIEQNAQAESDYGSPAIKRILSRWIPEGGRAIAEAMNTLQLNRYVDPPRRFNFSVMREEDSSDDPVLGTGYQLSAWMLQDETGALADVPIQLTALDPDAALIEVEAEEMLFGGDPLDLTNRAIIIDASTRDVNLRTLHDSLYPEPTGDESPAITVTCTIQSGVVVGSSSTGAPAFDTGTWPAGIDLVLVNRGTIAGRGGSGGGGSDTGGGQAGNTGGLALKVQAAIDLDGTSGAIWGGGGGGGGGAAGGGDKGGGGGGGAGDAGGTGGSTNGGTGTLTAGGSGGPAGGGSAGRGGDGGGPGLSGSSGQDGLSGQGGSGGSPGPAIDGWSLVTVTTDDGDVRGTTIN